MGINLKELRIGEIHTMKCGYTIEIIDYKDANDVTIKFLETDEVIEGVRYGNIKKKSLKPRFSPTVYGWGITGTEKIRDDNGSMLKSYRVWGSMIGRCYGEVYNKRNPNYIGCEVCEEWRLYSNFKKWFDENYYTLEDEDVQLDKDLICNNLGLESKLYSPTTCLFLPKGINVKLIRLNKDKKFTILPSGNFRIRSKTEKTKEVYETYEEALEGYKQDRLLSIRTSLENYKDKIPSNVYDEIYNIKIK